MLVFVFCHSLKTCTSSSSFGYGFFASSDLAYAICCSLSVFLALSTAAYIVASTLTSSESLILSGSPNSISNACTYGILLAKLLCSDSNFSIFYFF